MKKLIILLIIPFIASCDLFMEPDYPVEEGYNLRYDLPPIEDMHFLNNWEIHDVGDILSVIVNSGKFGYQNDPNNEWKTPKEFYDDGGGDCEDYAIFCAYFMYTRLGIAP